MLFVARRIILHRLQCEKTVANTVLLLMLLCMPRLYPFSSVPCFAPTRDGYPNASMKKMRRSITQVETGPIGEVFSLGLNSRKREISETGHQHKAAFLLQGPQVPV